MSDLTTHPESTEITISTESIHEVVNVDHYVDYGAGAPTDVPLPLVRIEIEEKGEGYRAAYLTVPQARSLAAALHVATYHATTAAQHAA